MGKTITTYFLEGTPKGIQSIQISNRTLIAYIIPRSELKKCQNIKELETPCLYMLFGEGDDQDVNKAYIGETDNFIVRVLDHNRKKDFWQKAFVFTTMASNLNKADILYLEYLAYSLANEVGNFDLSENGQIPGKPTLQRHASDTMKEFFHDVKFITEFSGYDIFRKVELEKKSKLLFYTSGRKSNAIGFYDENGFTVLKSSVIDSTSVKSLKGVSKREEMIKKFTYKKDGVLYLKQNLVFNSPSTAAKFCVGRSTNGWNSWKTKDGKTLDEIYRK